MASYIRGWIQMVLAPNDLFSWNNKYNKYNEYNVTVTFTCFFLSYAHSLTLCMLASWSHEGVVFLDFLPSSHSITSSLFPCLGSTDASCSHLGDPVLPSPRWRPHSQGPRTLPYRDPEQSHSIAGLRIILNLLLKLTSQNSTHIYTVDSSLPAGQAVKLILS